MTTQRTYTVKMAGPDANPTSGQILYNCSSLAEVKKEIEFQRVAFPYSAVYCVDRKTGKRIEV